MCRMQVISNTTATRPTSPLQWSCSHRSNRIELNLAGLEWTELLQRIYTVSQNRSSAIAEGPRDASCQLKSYQLPCNSAETTSTTSHEQIEVMKLEGYSGTLCNKHVHSTMTRSSRSHCPVGVINKPKTVELWISPVYRRHAMAKFSKSTM